MEVAEGQVWIGEGGTVGGRVILITHADHDSGRAAYELLAAVPGKGGVRARGIQMQSVVTTYRLATDEEHQAALASSG